MSTDKDSLQQRATQIEQEQAQMRLLKLSNKSIPLAVVISILIPIGGYIYTGRWKSMFIFLGCLTAINSLIIISARNQREGFEGAFSTSAIIATIVAPIDNALGIRRAREKMKELS